MNTYIESLNAALTARFTDKNEIQDVAEYGCSAGVSGFIYTSELAKFFEEHQEGIEYVLEGLGIKPSDLVSDPTCWEFDEIKQNAVWTVVEDWCQARA